MSFFILNDLIAKCLSLLLIIISSFIVIRNLEKSGALRLIPSIVPILIFTTPIFSETPPVSLMTKKINEFVSWMGSDYELNNENCYTLLFYVLFALALLLYSLFGNYKKGSSSIKTNVERENEIRNFCEKLQDRYKQLSRKDGWRDYSRYGWDDSKFVPLEILAKNRANDKKILEYKDLLSCIRRNRVFYSFQSLIDLLKQKPIKTVFYLVGDPGSGKSVTLRKLCLDLLEEAKNTKKIPVYVNLKKWNHEWTATKPPSQKDLIDFIINTLKSGDENQFVNKFIDTYFLQLLEEGRWYFVFDSFDEIPCLLGSGNTTEIIESISALLHTFLISGKQNGGIVASRLFNTSPEQLKAEVTLSIQELNDEKIKKILNKNIDHSMDVIDKLFKEREDLVVLCRNPLWLSLFVDYVQVYGTKFPQKQIDVYDHYIDNSLYKFNGRLKEAGLTKEDVISAATELTAFMQQSTMYGLECPCEDVYRLSGGKEHWKRCLDLLKCMELCRFDDKEQTVSFIHRRFQEVFLAKNFNNGTIVPDYSKIIPTSSGLRDALELYCEINEEKAFEIARFCWNIVKENMQYRTSLDNEGSRKLINTLYFMVGAFRNQKSALEEFGSEFEELVIKNLDTDTHFIVQLALVNTLALFDEKNDSIPQMVLRTFELKNRWLDDVIVDNCRLIKKPDKRIVEYFIRFFYQQKESVYKRQFSSTQFSLSKVQGFGYVRIAHVLHYIWLLIESLASGISAVLLLWNACTHINNIYINYIMIYVGVFMISFYIHRDVNLWRIIVRCLAYFLLISIGFLLIINNSESYFGLIIFSIMAKIIFLMILTMAIIDVPFLLYLVFAEIKRQASKSYDIKTALHAIVKTFRETEKAIKIGLFCYIILILLIIFIDVFQSIEELKYLGNALSVILVIIFLCLLIAAIVYVIYIDMKDKQTIKRIPISERLDKKDLITNIDRLHENSHKVKYLNILIAKETRLVGTWPDSVLNSDGQRIKYKHDGVEHAMSILEYQNLKADKQIV